MIILTILDWQRTIQTNQKRELDGSWVDCAKWQIIIETIISCIDNVPVQSWLNRNIERRHNNVTFSTALELEHNPNIDMENDQ